MFFTMAQLLHIRSSVAARFCSSGVYSLIDTPTNSPVLKLAA
jgi:hypothetical protein